ncbi:MAG: archaellin/type IV pilin N-terminal domain-containing protein [Candidatus Bathyarchaeia archaeon]
MITRYPREVFHRRKGLSTVVTTLIILAFAVLLALTVIIYTNGVTRARMKSTGQEDVRFHKEHAWVDALDNGTDRAVVAFKLHNLGGKSISLQRIDVRGTEMDWSDVYYHIVNKTSEGSLLYSEIYYFDWGSLVGPNVTVDGYNYTRATGNVWVNSGDTIIIYIKAPEIIFKDNIGQPISLAVSTVNANYFTECVAESAS